MKRSGALTILVLSHLTCGCVHQPQSPAEFRQVVRGGAFMSRLEEKTVSRDFDATFAGVERNAGKCFNATETHSTPGKYGPEVQNLDYHATIERPRDGFADIAVQMNTANMIGDIPPGGVYFLVIDVEKTDAKATRVTAYDGGKGSGMIDTVMTWAEGKQADCP